MSYKKNHMSFNIKQHVNTRVVFKDEGIYE